MDIFNEQLKPMLLSEVKEPFNDSNYLFELKFDGTRALIFVEPNDIKIINRRGINLNNTYPELLNIKKTVKQKCIFDGEIILMQNGKPSFSKLQERAHLRDNLKINYMQKKYPVTFICYDILYEKKDLTSIPLIERKKILEKYENTDYFVKTKYILENGIDFYNLIKKENLEGIVAKTTDSLYYFNKRSSDWLKIKNWGEEDFLICGYDEKSAEFVASILLGQEEKGKIKYIGKVSVGKNNPDFSQIKKCPKLLISPLFEYENADYIYLEPKLKCTVEFLEKTKNGHLRQPNYKGLTQ